MKNVTLRPPQHRDGARMWELARDSGKLDLNSSYAYVLWCRDFAETSVVAELDGRLVGYTIGYLRPQAPQTLFVWQVGVDAASRGNGIALTMLESIVESVGASRLETTVTADNTASVALFQALARRHGAPLERRELFGSSDFPDEHAAEDLYSIEPIGALAR